MFSEIIHNLEIEKYKEILKNATEIDFYNVLTTEKKLEIEDFAVLISDIGEQHLEELAQLANKITKQRFGLTVHLYAPIYLSNYCENNCLYCGFRRDNKIIRKRLTIKEYKKELEILVSEGMQNILLVAGSDSRLSDNNYIFEIIRYTKELAASVSIEIEAQKEEVYRELVKAGADGLVIYQETYLENEYQKLHPTGMKKDFNFRINTPDRGACAGFRRVGIGFLLGLADWQKDIFYLVYHLKYLIKKYWRVLFTVSLPRYRDAGVNFKTNNMISDKKFTQLICALRIFFNDTPIYLSTREAPKLRDGLIKCGVTNISAGSKTNPGAYYCDEINTGTQFNVVDNRTIKEIAEQIRKIGYEPVWKDWEAKVLNA